MGKKGEKAKRLYRNIKILKYGKRSWDILTKQFLYNDRELFDIILKTNEKLHS